MPAVCVTPVSAVCAAFAPVAVYLALSVVPVMPAPAVDAKLALQVVYIAPVPAMSMASAPDVDAETAPVARYVTEVCHAVSAVDAVDEDNAVDVVDVVGTASTQPTPSKQPAVIAPMAPVSGVRHSSYHKCSQRPRWKLGAVHQLLL